MQLSEAEWRQKLTPDQYRVLRQKGTEAPFTGDLLVNNAKGSYVCAACGAKLFSSSSKYESSLPGLAGWPSFAEAVKSGAVKLADDSSYGMQRIEVTCSNCDSHLGHLFDDDSSPSGQHYCINSTCLQFKKEDAKDVKSRG